MVLTARRPEIGALVLASAMLSGGVLLLVAWPFKQLTIVPVIALVVLAPSVHALLVRGGAQRWTLIAGGTVAGIAAVVPWLQPLFSPGSGCAASAPPTVLAVGLAGMVTFGAAYVLAVAVTMRLVADAAGAGRMGLGILAGVAIMALGIAAWIPLFNLMLSEVTVWCLL